MDGVDSVDSLQSPLTVQPPPPREETVEESPPTEEPVETGTGENLDTYA